MLSLSVDDLWKRFGTSTGSVRTMVQPVRIQTDVRPTAGIRFPAPTSSPLESPRMTVEITAKEPPLPTYRIAPTAAKPVEPLSEGEIRGLSVRNPSRLLSVARTLKDPERAMLLRRLFYWFDDPASRSRMLVRWMEDPSELVRFSRPLPAERWLGLFAWRETNREVREAIEKVMRKIQFKKQSMPLYGGLERSVRGFVQRPDPGRAAIDSYEALVGNMYRRYVRDIGRPYTVGRLEREILEILQRPISPAIQEMAPERPKPGESRIVWPTREPREAVPFRGERFEVVPPGRVVPLTWKNF